MVYREPNMGKATMMRIIAGDTFKTTSQVSMTPRTSNPNCTLVSLFYVKPARYVSRTLSQDKVPSMVFRSYFDGLM